MSSSLENIEESVYTQPRECKKVLVVLISSNRGLCGGFNSNISKKATEVVKTKYKEQLLQGHVEFLTIGKQGQRQLKYFGLNIADEKNNLFDSLNFDNVSEVASGVMQAFAEGTYDCVEIVYNQFKNAATQILTSEKFLPVEMEEDGKEKQANLDYIYEPSIEHIIHELIPRSLKIQFYKALLDSNAAEHGARMTAMHQATDNATSLLSELTLQYNKARQTTITNEILEIVSGAEALNG